MKRHRLSGRCNPVNGMADWPRAKRHPAVMQALRLDESLAGTVGRGIRLLLQQNVLPPRIALRRAGDRLPRLPGGKTLGVCGTRDRKPFRAEKETQWRIGRIDDLKDRLSGRPRIAEIDLSTGRKHTCPESAIR